MASKTTLDEQVLAAIRKRPQGASDEMVWSEVPGVGNAEKMHIVNRLLNAKRIQLFEKGPDKTVYYKEVTADEAAKFKGLGPEEVMLYQMIKQAGNTGLWTKDMRTRSNLAAPTITKLLKVLESRGLVKAVKSVANPSRKVYMLAELEPSRELTGGAWYTNQEFDAAFIEVLRSACMAFIERKGDATLKEVSQFISAKKFAKVDLRQEDIYSILMTLVYDGRVDAVEGEDPHDDDEHFRPMVHVSPATTSFTNVPCGMCPVLDQCRDDGLISPATCEYYNKWLQF